MIILRFCGWNAAFAEIFMSNWAMMSAAPTTKLYENSHIRSGTKLVLMKVFNFLTNEKPRANTRIKITSTFDNRSDVSKIHVPFSKFPVTFCWTERVGHWKQTRRSLRGCSTKSKALIRKVIFGGEDNSNNKATSFIKDAMGSRKQHKYSQKWGKFALM